MAYGSVNVKLRPVRFAFLVDPAETAALLQAIRINSFLWGGVYNPIIPVFRKVTRDRGSSYSRGATSVSIINQYLEMFDPDFVVALGGCVGRNIDVGGRESVEYESLLNTVETFRVPQYGIGIFEIAQHYFATEHKYVRRHPVDFCFPEFARSYRLFLMSVFGQLPEAAEGIFSKGFEPAFGGSRVACSLSNYVELLDPDKMFLSRLTAYQLRPRGFRRGYVFFLDAGKPADIIDYWNLRALGWNILPVPKQATKFESVRRHVVDFVEAHFEPERYPDHNTAQLLISRSTPFNPADDEAIKFITSLGIDPDVEAEKCKISISYVYPPSGSSIYIGPTDAAQYGPIARETRHSISGQEERFQFKTLDPEFLAPTVPGNARFANDIELRVTSDKEMMAEVMPEGGRELAGAIGGFDFRQWRFTPSGITYLSALTDWTINLVVPKAEDVFTRWLKARQWDVRISPAGRIARQMLKHLGGVRGITILADESVISLLDSINRKETMSVDELWGKLQKIANRNERFPDPNALLQRLTDNQMIRLVMKVQCPVCTQWSWHTVGDADYELNCVKCLDSFKLPPNPRNIKWAYKTFGPFSASVQDYGAYAVLLTLRFFSVLLNGSTTPLLSFEAEKDGRKIEADLGLLYKETFGGGTARTDLIFAECKTYNDFEEKDAAKAIYMAEHFPKAILIFATLKRLLKEDERSLITSVTNRLRGEGHTRLKERVLILTGTELFSFWKKPPGCWEGFGDLYKEYANVWDFHRNLPKLCETSQRIHLQSK